jgi:hypothetical protein
MSTAKFSTWLNPDGTENYKCRAWVNFDGLTNPLTIRASGGVSSVTDNGTGDYTVNFTTAMPDANYALTGTASNTVATRVLIGICPRDNIANFSTTSIRFEVKVGSGSGLVDSLFTSVAIFR